MKAEQARVRRFKAAMAALGATTSGALGDPVYPGICHPAVARLQASMLLEEVTETMVALVGHEETERLLIRRVRELDDVETKQGDAVAIADGLADTQVIVLGTAESTGIDLSPVFDEVMAANERKIGPGARIRHDGKLLKPVDWRGPDIAGVLARQKGQTGPHVRPHCPKCGSLDVSTERRPDGDHHCGTCRHVWPNMRNQ